MSMLKVLLALGIVVAEEDLVRPDLGVDLIVMDPRLGTCAAAWISPGDGANCTVAQHGCPAVACDGDPAGAWCLAAAPHANSWFYCSPPACTQVDHDYVAKEITGQDCTSAVASNPTCDGKKHGNVYSGVPWGATALAYACPSPAASAKKREGPRIICVSVVLLGTRARARSPSTFRAAIRTPRRTRIPFMRRPIRGAPARPPPPSAANLSRTLSVPERAGWTTTRARSPRPTTRSSGRTRPAPFGTTSGDSRR